MAVCEPILTPYKQAEKESGENSWVWLVVYAVTRYLLIVEGLLFGSDIYAP